ncbi:unnamed protein product [Alopecurus aequalis]
MVSYSSWRSRSRVAISWCGTLSPATRAVLTFHRSLKKDEIIGAAVLRDAGDVHFRVALLVGRPENERALACIYSADANLWGDIISMQLSHKAYMMRFTFDNLILNPGVLVGDSLYRELDISGILEFDLKRKSLDVIRVPVIMYIDRFSVIRDEGGGLGFLYLIDFTAQLWRRKTDSDGVASWVLGRTIELDNLLSLDPNQHVRILVQGFAEENNLVFLSTVIGLFLVQLQSLHFTFMEHSEYNFMYHPFESVYTAETRDGDEHGDLDLSAQHILQL